MIVIVGSPLQESGLGGPRAAGLAVEIARAAAAAGGDVQLVGKVGEDLTGEAVLLDLARSNVGHAALIRDPSKPTGTLGDVGDGELEEALLAEPEEQPAAPAAISAPALEAADLELALRYLPDYRVLVVADNLSGHVLDTVLAAARWSGAALVAVVTAGDHPTFTDEATVLERPGADANQAFGGIVGAYAAALDRGEEPKEAFAIASSAGGWSAVGD